MLAQIPICRGVLCGDQIRETGAVQHAAIHAPVPAGVDIADTQGVVKMRPMSIVAEAVMLLFRVMQHQPELHALTGQFAIAEAADTGEDGSEIFLPVSCGHRPAGITVRPPLIDHPLQIAYQQLYYRPKIGSPAVAVAMGAVSCVVITCRACAGSWSGAVQILPPKQKLNRVISGGNIGFHLIDLMQGFCQQCWCNPRRIDRFAADRQRLVGDHVGGVEWVLVGFGAVAGGRVVDQPLVERPGVHLAFPRIHDAVAEAVGLCLLIGMARGHPCRPGRSEAGPGRCRKETIGLLTQCLCCH